jgi:hypothetical protein
VRYLPTPKLEIFVGRLVGVIIFGSIRFLSKKVTKPKFVLKKNPTGFGSVRFGFLGQKLVQTGFGSFFFRFGSVFSVLGL